MSNLKNLILSGQSCLSPEISALQQKAMTHLNTALPDGYIDFLRRTNGYADERIILFASKRVVLKWNHKFYALEDVIEVNQHAFSKFPKEILLGICGENWLTYDNDSERYLRYSEMSLAQNEAVSFLNFNHCVSYALMELQSTMNHLTHEAVA